MQRSFTRCSSICSLRRHRRENQIRNRQQRITDAIASASVFGGPVFADGEKSRRTALIDQRHPLHVILVAARNPLNIGAAARAMANFGFAHLSVVNPYQIAFRQARSAVGASALLASAQEFSSVAEAVADCALVVGTTASRYRELKHRLETLDKGAALIRKGLKSSPTALLFGSERTGLSNDDLSHCQWLMTIPTGGMQPSMNLGQAVA